MLPLVPCSSPGPTPHSRPRPHGYPSLPLPLPLGSYKAARQSLRAPSAETWCGLTRGPCRHRTFTGFRGLNNSLVPRRRGRNPMLDSREAGRHRGKYMLKALFEG